MNLSPSNNLNLLGYSEFFLSLKNLHDKNLLPNKIIFSGANGIGKSTFVYHLINYIFSKNEVNKYNFENNNSDHALGRILTPPSRPTKLPL